MHHVHGYTQVEMLHTWVMVASIVRRCFYKPLSSVSSLSYYRWDHEAWDILRAWSICTCLYTVMFSPFLKLFQHLFSGDRVCLRPRWLGIISSSGWLIHCPCVFKGLYPLPCVCFELVCAHGDSLDESKLLFWNKLDWSDLEPETCVVILAECCRWPL